MKSSLIACLAALALLTACSSDDKSASAGGAGGSNAAGGVGGLGGVGGRGVAGNAIPGSQEDLAQNAGDRIFFDSDQSRLNDKARAIVERQVAWLRQNPQVSVWVAGNCDERGTQEYNLALGARRANSVRDYLVSQGVPASRISTVSFGKEKPIDAGSGDDADQHNRNAHTAIVSGARMR